MSKENRVRRIEEKSRLNNKIKSRKGKKIKHTRKKVEMHEIMKGKNK